MASILLYYMKLQKQQIDKAPARLEPPLPKSPKRAPARAIAAL